jgi:murein DD-endopeptidase MepM/ murein hydrolase activator NlpD
MQTYRWITVAPTAALVFVLIVLNAAVAGCGSELPRSRQDGQITTLPDGTLPDGTPPPTDSSAEGGLPDALTPKPDAAADAGIDDARADARPADAAASPDSAPAKARFGYPVGDGTTYPAGGWVLWQNLSHYWAAWGGRHLGHDISLPGGVAAIGKPVLSVADGKVLYAKPNSSTYKNVVLIEHPLPNGSRVCSFYAHITTPSVQVGAQVTRGQQIATILDWAQASSGGASSNSHLHYVLLSDALCQKAAATGNAGGSGICGYDKGGSHPLGRTDLQNEPFDYTAINDACGNHKVADGFISPTQFIDQNHF